MAAGLDSERRLEFSDYLEGLRDVAGGARGYEAVGRELLLARGPVLILGVVVGGVWDGHLSREGEAQSGTLEGSISRFSPEDFAWVWRGCGPVDAV